MIDAAVRSECLARGITRVCHFTQSRNLPQILTDPRGIRSTADLEAEAPDVLNRNDPVRLDRKEDYISCSIEYPNSWNFRQFQRRERLFSDWVVLILDPSILWRPTTYFSPRNAASPSAVHARGLAGFQALFAPQVRGAYGRWYVRTDRMLPSCPTDDQAEVLIQRQIERSLIWAVAVASDEQADLERARLKLVPGVPDLAWIVAPAFYTGAWSTLVRRGERPAERLLSRAL